MKVKRFESRCGCWYSSSKDKRWGDLAMELIQTQGRGISRDARAAKANARGPRTHQGGGSRSALAPAPPTALPALLAAHQAVN